MSNEEIAIKIYNYTNPFKRHLLFYNVYSLDSAFIWSKTEEGYEFWLNQYKNMYSGFALTKFMLKYFYNNHFIDLSLI